jgi:four helix bundle protein
VALNIAEGNAKYSSKDQVRFLDIAHTSSLKCASTLDIWVAAGLVSEKQIAAGKSFLAEIVAMLFGMKKRILKDG